MLKESNLAIKYWPEMIRTANYLRNRQPVLGKSITPFEASYVCRPQLGYLRRIEQIGYFQDRKPSTGWKKFQDRAIKCRLLGYEGIHIYRILIPGGSIMRYSNVAWTENLPQSSSNTPSSVDPILSTKRKYSTLDSTSSVDLGATNTQDLSSDECLSDFFHKNSCHNPVTPLATPTLPSVTPSAISTLPPTTPFITAHSTPLDTIETPTSTPSNISSYASTTSSLTSPPHFIPNRSVT